MPWAREGLGLTQEPLVPEPEPPTSKAWVTGFGKMEDPNDWGDMFLGNAIGDDSSRGNGIFMTLC